METRQGLLTKLGAFTVVAIGLVAVGKKHIASHKEDRHRLESDASVEHEDDEFMNSSFRPGFPSANPNLNYERSGRESKYVGSGAAYATRTQGDRLTIWNLITKKFINGDEE